MDNPIGPWDKGIVFMTELQARQSRRHAKRWLRRNRRKAAPWLVNFQARYHRLLDELLADFEQRKAAGDNHAWQAAKRAKLEHMV